MFFTDPDGMPVEILPVQSKGIPQRWDVFEIPFLISETRRYTVQKSRIYLGLIPAGYWQDFDRDPVSYFGIPVGSRPKSRKYPGLIPTGFLRDPAGISTGIHPVG